MPYVEKVPTIALSFAPGETMSMMALLGHVDNDKDIWIQLNPAEVEKLMAEINATDTTDIPTLEPKIGRYCLALDPEDGNWYRAVVSSIVADKVLHGKISLITN